ncbi:hypothetical protein ACYAX6_09680 [Klebsiella pneumoniae]
MTDITELAQREKFENWARSQQLSLAYGDCGYFYSSTEMAWRAVKAQSAELVEALEKAQHRIDELENDEVRQRLANAEHQLYMAELAKHNLKASRKAQFCKRRAAEKRIAELEEAEQKLCAANVTLDARAELAERQLAELESRTATVAAADVLAERKRQVSAEGWTPGHDDEYEHGELADAAGCYALSSELFDCAGEPPRPWPWPDEWWKPTNRRRDLVKAGALILAEIERLDRAAGIKVEAE